MRLSGQANMHFQIATFGATFEWLCVIKNNKFGFFHGLLKKSLFPQKYFLLTNLRLIRRLYHCYVVTNFNVD